MTNYLHPRPGEYVDAARAADIEDEARRDAVDAAADDRDDQAEPLDTGQIKPDSMTTTDRDDLYNQAVRAYGCSPVYSPGIRAVVDLVLDAHPAERQPWEVLREAADICATHYVEGYRSAVLGLASRLEAEHRAAQEKAVAEAAREKLIEQAAQVLHRAGPFGQIREWADLGDDQEFFIVKARALADAGFLAAPKATDGGAA